MGVEIDSIDEDEIKAHASGINGATNSIRSQVNSIVQKINNLNKYWSELFGYNENLMEDRTTETLRAPGTYAASDPGETAIYGYRAKLTSANMADAFGRVTNLAEKINSELDAIDKCAIEASVSADEVKNTRYAVDDGLRDFEINSSSGQGSSGTGGFNGGGGSSYGGGFASPYSSSTSIKGIVPSTGALAGATVAGTLKSTIGDNSSSKSSSSNTSKASSSDNITSKSTTNTNTTSSNKSSSAKSTSSSHSGGGYSGSGGYSSKDENKKKDDTSKGVLTSVGDIIKNGKISKLPSSSSPIFGSGSVSGSAVIPVTSGVSAAAAAGIGAKAFLDKRKDDDDDDKEDDDINLEHLETNQDETNLNEEKRVRSVEDYELESDGLNDGDSENLLDNDLVFELGDYKEEDHDLMLDDY